MSLGLIFPGQGSQKLGMLSDLLDAFPVIRETLDEADDALSFKLSKVILEGPEEALGRTENTQPALLAAGIATWRALKQDVALDVVCVAGHSLGEYTALVSAGAIAFDDAMRIVRLRGQAMQQAVAEGEGLMAAILGLQDAAIESVCDVVPGLVQPANYNAPGQVVIAGEKAPVLAAIEAAKQAGAKRALPLAVSVPAHTSLMQPAGDVLSNALEQVSLRMSAPPVVHNVDAQPAKDVADLKTKLLRQVCEPVRFVACVETMKSLGVTRLIECGPGAVLTGLVKRIDRSLEAYSTGGLDALEKTREAFAS